tara:strand:- start:383 stop:1075 length:693 start_codon:yes stop_codon:yes gene_type:complete
MKYKISVICSVYNSCKWLPKYLNSVNDQFCREFEIVFIDANSNDNSLSLINNYNFRDGIKTTIIEQQERVSIYKAWNIGIKACEGEYIMNWNTDDLIYRSGLQTYSSYIERYPEVDFFYSPCCVINDQNLNSIVGLRNWPEYSHECLLKICIGGPFPIMKKSAVEQCGFFKEKYLSSGDYEMWLNLSKRGFTFKKIPDIIGCFYQREDSVSMDNLKMAQEEDREIQQLHI